MDVIRDVYPLVQIFHY